MTENFMRKGRGLLLRTLCLLLLWQMASCEGPKTINIGGETHFLTLCDSDAEDGSCGDDLACLYSVCTLACEGQQGCSAFADSKCIGSDGELASANASSSGTCDLPCSKDSECQKLSSSHLCDDGFCRAKGSNSVKVASNDSIDCVSGSLNEEQLLVLGDSFFAASHEITARLEQRLSALKGESDSSTIQDASRLLDNALALSGKGIADQYEGAEDVEDIRLVIMNGGGADATIGKCETINGECSVLVSASLAAEELLGEMAENGIENVIYAFYPNPVDDEQREMIDALRPLIQGVCEEAPLDCHWLDLRPSFEDHYDDYISDDGRNPTAEGSQIVAEELWALLQPCLAP